MRRTDILAAVHGLAALYDKQLTKPLINIWTAALNELSTEELAKAVNDYVRNPNSTYFPKPGQILALAKPEEDCEEQASLIVDHLFSALRSYGGDPVGTERAKQRIGEIGWLYVQSQGGWQSFIQSCQSDDAIPIYKSQARKSIMGLIRRKRNGIAMHPDGRKISDTTVDLKSLGVEIKGIE